MRNYNKGVVDRAQNTVLAKDMVDLFAFNNFFFLHDLDAAIDSILFPADEANLAKGSCM